MAIRLERFLTSKTVEYIKRVNRLDSTMGGDVALQDLSRLWDKAEPLPISPLAHEFALICRGDKAQKDKWFEACLAEAVKVIFDSKGNIKASIRNRLKELSGLDSSSLDKLLYGSWSRDQVHSALLLGYCQNILSGLPEIHDGDFFVPSGLGREDFDPELATNEPFYVLHEINQKVSDLYQKSKGFKPFLESVFQREDEVVLRYWRWAQQCATRCHRSEASNLRFLRSMQQLSIALINNLEGRLGSIIAADDIAVEYERLGKMVGKRTVDAVSAETITHCFNGFGRYVYDSHRCGQECHDHRNEMAAFLGQEHIGSSVTLEAFQVESCMINFSNFGLQRAYKQPVIDIDNTGANVRAVMNYFDYKKQSYNYGQWYAHGHRYDSKSYVGRFLLWVTPKSHSRWIEERVHRLEEYKNAHPGKYAEQMQMHLELIQLSREWLSARQQPDQRYWFSINKKVVSVLGLVQQLEQDAQRLLVKIEEASSQQVSVTNQNPSAVNQAASQNQDDRQAEQTAIVVSPPRRQSRKAIFFMSAFAASFVATYGTNFISHPHVGHMMGMVIRLGFAGVASFAGLKCLMPNVSGLWQNRHPKTSSIELVKSRVKDGVSKEEDVPLTTHKADDVELPSVSMSVKIPSV